MMSTEVGYLNPVTYRYGDMVDIDLPELAVEKAHWEKEVISPHEIVQSSGQMVCTDNVKPHEFWGGRYVPPDADEEGVCFMKQMKSHLQLEVYGVKLTLW